MFIETSIEIVLRKMNYPDNVIVRKGLFPETVVDLDKKFAFVSLDVDFDKSTLEGLRYLYSRLSQEGYIFIHNYNYCDTLNLSGVKNTILQYEKENNQIICKVQIFD